MNDSQDQSLHRQSEERQKLAAVMAVLLHLEQTESADRERNEARRAWRTSERFGGRGSW